MRSLAFESGSIDADSAPHEAACLLRPAPFVFEDVLRIVRQQPTAAEADEISATPSSLPVPTKYGTRRLRSREAPRLEDAFGAVDRTEHLDVEIVAGMARGETWAADALYERVHEVVNRSLRRLLRFNDVDFDDLRQSVFERLIAVVTTQTLTPECNLAVFAKVIATRLAIDQLRRRTRENRLLSLFGVSKADDTANGLEREIEARSFVRRLQHVLCRMSDKYVETVLLHDVIGCDLASIAATTNVSIAAAQSRLVRGRKELLSRLREEGLAR